MSKRNRNRVGLLVDAESLPRWAAEAVVAMVEETSATVTEIVSNPGSSRSAIDVARRLIDLRAWAPIAAYKELSATPRHSEPIPVGAIPALADATVTHAPAQPRDGLGVELPERGVDALGRTDVAILSGYGVLLGDALTAPTEGVMGFHHGDVTEYRGQPAGFWEFLYDEPVCGLTVQRLTNTLDGGEIVAYDECYIGTNPTFESVQADLYARSDELLVDAVRTLLESDGRTDQPASLGDVYSQPRAAGDVLTYLYLNAVRSLVFSVGRRSASSTDRSRSMDS